MTLPHARKIVVAGKTWPYIFKYGKGRFCESSASSIRLTVDLGDNKYLQAQYGSKLWPEEDGTDDYMMSHKNSFRPSDVRKVIESHLAGEGLPDLETWSPTED